MKLHLGCGKIYIPGFVHIDCVQYPHVDHVCEIDSLPIADNTVDLIYACHVLEHFRRKETVRVLKEWRRVLKVGGRLRLSVPDFGVLAKLYHDGWFELEDIIGPIFGKQDYLYNIHYNVFDDAALRGALKGAGFVNIYVWDWRTTEHADVDDYSQAYLPHMDKEHGTLISLNLEAVK